jgi:hypothetical protein
MRTVVFVLLAVAALLMIVPNTVQAIPAFARKYGFNCNMCHTGYPKLNDYGQRFRDNGYQLAGQQGKEKNIFQVAPPISMRTSAGLMVSHSEKRTSSSFNLNGLDLLAAGVMHKDISFLLIYTPRIDEPAADYSGSAEANNPSQPGGLESANVVFSNVVPRVLNVRVGRFEPAYHAFSSKRSYYLLQGYDVYGFATPGNGFVFDDNQLGLEMTGHLRNGFKYGAGIVNGNGADPDVNNAKDVYLNLFQTIGRGDGQSAGQRVGVFGYYGWQPTDSVRSFVGGNGATDGKGNVGFFRVGGDVSLNWRTFNLMALFMYGADDEKLNPYESSDYDFTGGFARLDWAGLMNNRLVMSALYNWVRPPSYDTDRGDVDAGAGLMRYYLGDWTAVNVALHVEYTYRKIRGPYPVRDHEIAALVDFDF